MFFCVISRSVPKGSLREWLRSRGECFLRCFLQVTSVTISKILFRVIIYAEESEEKIADALYRFEIHHREFFLSL